MKTLKYALLGVSLTLLSLTFTSCNNNDTTSEKVEEAAEDFADAFRTEREEMMADLKEARENINERIAKMESNLENASDEAKTEMEEQLKQLNEWGSEVDDKIDNLGKDLSSGWEAFKTDVKQTLQEIDKELDESFNG